MPADRKPLAWLSQRGPFLQRFVLAEVLGPPVALRGPRVGAAAAPLAAGSTAPAGTSAAETSAARNITTPPKGR